MGLVEEAIRRLEELRRAGAQAGTGSNPALPAEAVDAITVSASSEHVADRQPLSPARTGDERKSLPTHEVNLERLRSKGFVTPDAARTRVADEFRVLKRPLIENLGGNVAGRVERANRIMITSALPGEGKSFTALNLALSMASEMDSTVLLIDADVVQQSVGALLDVADRPGLMDVLSSPGVDLGDALIRTSIPKLVVLPAGRAHPQATEFLASQAMARLVDQMATRYPDRILIFDSPPLVVTTEARVLATHMGQIVLVVEADRTTRGALASAVSALESCPVVMTVLNKATSNALGGYGYGYGLAARPRVGGVRAAIEHAA